MAVLPAATAKAHVLSSVSTSMVTSFSVTLAVTPEGTVMTADGGEVSVPVHLPEIL